MNDIMLNITGQTKVYGIIGQPLQHTLSPFLHNQMNKYFKQQAVYVPFPVQEKNLKRVLEGAHALNIAGLNVTMPYKQDILPYLVEVDPLAQQVGAVNTLVYTQNGYRGYNTDIDGLQMALKQKGIACKNKKIGIIGAGGAAYATTLCAAISGADEIHLFNRTFRHLEQLKAHFSDYIDCPMFLYNLGEMSKSKLDILIQATGVGMGSLEGQMPLGVENLLTHAEVAIDLIYKPVETPFLKLAKEKGIFTMNGWDMLFYQAYLAYEKMHTLKWDAETIMFLKNTIENEMV
jgi:shikimate dehydrogenase